MCISFILFLDNISILILYIRATIARYDNFDLTSANRATVYILNDDPMVILPDVCARFKMCVREAAEIFDSPCTSCRVESRRDIR